MAGLWAWARAAVGWWCWAVSGPSRKARSQGRRSAPPSQRPAEEEPTDNYDDSDEDFESQSDDDGAHNFGSRKPQERRQPRNSPSATPVPWTGSDLAAHVSSAADGADSNFLFEFHTFADHWRC